MLCTLISKEQITPSITTFWFEPKAAPDYVAGQFIELTLPHDNADDRGDRRWFTLSSSPTEALLGITTKLSEEPSSFMKKLFSLEPGATITMSAAMGDFVLPKDATIPLIFVVGGIGVTPVRSMLTWLADNNEQRDITVLYAVSGVQEAAFSSLLEQRARSLNYFMPNAERLTTKHILNTISELKKPLTYVSGPEELVEVFVAELQEAGVSGSRLVTDYFPGYGQI